MSRVGVALAAVVLASGCAAGRAAAPPAPPAAPPAAPSALPAAAITADQRVVAYPHGRWQLYGDGTEAAPYSWVWIPTGAPAPSPTR